LVGAIAVLAGAAGAGAQPAARGGKAKSTVTISSRVPAFSGKVKSPSAACVSGRRVQLYRRSGGDSQRLGADRTNSGGRWEVGVDPLQAGAYYAKVKPRSGGSVACRGARSEIVVVD
jgi:hypothetical protein